MKHRWVAHVWVFAGLIAAGLGVLLAHVIAPYNQHLSMGLTAILIMSLLMMLLGLFVWLHKKHRYRKQLSNQDPVDEKRLYQTHWLEIFSVLLVLIVFLGVLMIQSLSAGEFNFDPLRKYAFPLFLISVFVKVFIIFRSYFLVTNFLHQTPEINDTTDLDRLKPIVARCMYMALVFIVFMLLSILFAGFTLFNWGTVYDVTTGVVLSVAAALLNWYAPYENQLKQIQSTNALLDDELEHILQSWHNDLFPKF